MILAIDTATRWCGLALFDPAESQVLFSAGWATGQTQTVECAAAIDQALERQQIRPADLTAIAVAIGPGSYTGLRIGLAIAKGLALTNQAALLAVPTLDILAGGINQDQRPLLLTATAGRRRVIAAPYRWQSAADRWLPDGPADILAWDELLDSLAEPHLVAGEISGDARSRLASHPLTIPLAPDRCLRQPAVLAQIGLEKLRAGQTADPATLAPDYLRRPEGS